MLEAEDWKVHLRSGLNEIIEQAVREGARADQVFDALAEALELMKEDWSRDSGFTAGSDAGILEEPANDWPAADR